MHRYNGASGLGEETSELKAEMHEVKQLLAQAVQSGALASPARSAADSAAMHTPWSSPETGAAPYSLAVSDAFVSSSEGRC